MEAPPSTPSAISSQNEKFDEPPLLALPISPSDNDPNTINVVVQPGQTLRQIALRTLGQYNSELMRQIQSLNAGMTDPNHIEANQEIRLPRLSKSPIAQNAGGANDVSERN